MSPDDQRPDLDTMLSEAFERRDAGVGTVRPSLVDVRRRAQRRSSRQATARVGAAVLAGAVVVAGGWAVTARDEPRQAVPADGAVVLDGAGPADAGPPATARMTLTTEGLWAAVAVSSGTTVEMLMTLNPDIDFSQAPVPGTEIRLAGWAAYPATTVPPFPATTFSGATTTLWPGEGYATGTTYVPATTVPVASTVVVSDGTVPASTIPMTYPATVPPPGGSFDPTSTTVMSLNLAPGEILYEIVVGDYLHGIAERFCTTVDDLVARNGWVDGAKAVILPGQPIKVPGDAC